MVGDAVERPRGPGRLHVGTSGFSYPAWAPRFYPPGLRPAELLGAYAGRLPAVELNATYYRTPSAATAAAWAGAVPADFRFVVKAQRATAARALGGEPAPVVARLLEPLAPLGARLGAVLLRIPEGTPFAPAGLARLLATWPASVRLVLDLREPAWEVDEVHRLAADAGAAVGLTETDAAPDPILRRTAPFVYLRLRRTAYAPDELDAWARRLEPFLTAGDDAYVFFRHDADGASALAAEGLLGRLAAKR